MATSLVPKTRRLRTLAGYGAMLASTVGLYLVIRARGEERVAPVTGATAGAGWMIPSGPKPCL